MIKTQKGGKKGANYGWTIGGSTRQGLGACSTFGAASCLLLQASKHVLLSTYQQLVACASILSIALLIHQSCMYSKHQPPQNIHYYSLFWEPLSRRAIDYLQCYQCNTKHSEESLKWPTAISSFIASIAAGLKLTSSAHRKRKNSNPVQKHRILPPDLRAHCMQSIISIGSLLQWWGTCHSCTIKGSRGRLCVGQGPRTGTFWEWGPCTRRGPSTRWEPSAGPEFL
jgi:hypothetical protein